MAFVQTTIVDAKLDRSEDIPTNITRLDLLSTTNHAIDCFTKQKFSADLQAFLITYVISVNAYQPIFK
jgi:hypothetical protein